MTIDDINWPAMRYIEREINASRGGSDVSIHVVEHGMRSIRGEIREIGETTDHILLDLGYGVLGRYIREIDDDEAAQIMSLCLSIDLAYRNQIISREQAESCFARFLRNTGKPRRLFTNSNIDGTALTPITDATMDMGVIALDERFFSMIWVRGQD